MKRCEWSVCYDYTYRVCTKDIPLVEFYSCGRHASYYCLLCDEPMGRYLRGNSNDLCINWHFLATHTLKESSGNCVNLTFGYIALINNIYYEPQYGNKHKLCYILEILKTYPHFIYLIPEFSFSDVLNQFDEIEVNEWNLLAAVRNKPFSCLMCGGRFESFPSNEVFNAHKCKK